MFDDYLIDSLDHFFVNILQEPPHLDISILPDHHKELLKTVYEKHVDYLNSVKAPSASRSFNSLKSQLMRHNPQREKHLQRFKYVTSMLDEMRGENWSETFPQMKDLFE